LRKEEFKSLFDTYFEDVRRYILYRSGDEEAATDIAQETFMRVWEKQMVIDTQKVRGLLLKIASDLFISQYRRKQVSNNFFNTFQPNGTSSTPEDELSFQELQKAYDMALKTMPEKQRTVFLMNRIDEMKYKEIADQLGLSVKAIEKRMSLALEHLKTHLNDKITGLILFFMSFRFSWNKTEETSETKPRTY
jgi:RNA polymerase sigma-70 factor (ECF subfamily)